MDKNYLTPVKAIRKKCLECAGGRPKETRECETATCPLYPYRLGRNPRRAGIGGKKACFNSKSITQVGFCEPKQ